MQRTLLCLALLGLIAAAPAHLQPAHAQAAAPNPGAEASGPQSDLRQLVQGIQAKLREGKRTEADLAEDLKKFDALLEKYKGQKTDEVAQIVLMKAMLYMEVLENSDKAKEVLTSLKSGFPETTQGKEVDNILASIEKQAAAQKVRAGLVAGAKFPSFEGKDTDGKDLSLDRFKGKVLLVDFWATWCGPCIAELPTVKKAYEKYHAKGFEIFGISLDKEESALKSFVQKETMTWPQFFDGKGWQNRLAEQYGIQSIPATFLLDQEGKIVDQDLRGPALEAALAKLLP